MHVTAKILCLIGVVSLIATGSAMAQQAGSTSTSGAGGQNSGVAIGGSGGVTSGPAATGQPATLGTNGVPAAVPGQTDLLRHQGGVAITGEKKVRPSATQKGKVPTAPSH